MFVYQSSREEYLLLFSVFWALEDGKKKKKNIYMRNRYTRISLL